MFSDFTRRLRQVFGNAILNFSGRERVYILTRNVPVPPEGERKGWGDPRTFTKYGYRIVQDTPTEIHIIWRGPESAVKNTLAAHGIEKLWSVRTGWRSKAAKLQKPLQLT